MTSVFLDNNATTVLDPRVLEVVHRELAGDPANASSIHQFGQSARNRLTKARRQIAAHFNVRPKEIVFTSGGTEALNLVLRGLNLRGHVISSAAEHVAVRTTLESLPCETTFLSPGTWGAVQPHQVEEAIQPNTQCIALMAANNETGVKSDIHAIAAIAESRNIPFVVDGVALLGKEAFTIPDGVTAICFSGHKLHGPKGSGLAIIRTKIQPQITGGSQEHTLRGGTENLAAILGLAEAISLIDYPDVGLRDHLESGIKALYPEAEINGDGPRLSNTSNIAFTGLDGEGLLMSLDLAGIAASHGSACSSGSLEPSHVLLGMGYSRDRARSSLRFSLSRYTTHADIDHTLQVLEGLLSQKHLTSACK